MMNYYLNIQQKTRSDNYFPNISIDLTFMNTENNKTNEPHKLVLKFSQRLDLRSPHEHIALQN